MSYKKKAVFLDRDGVINKEVALLYKVEDFELMPDAVESVKAINESDFLAIVITNQSVVGKNLCSIARIEEIHEKMRNLFSEKGARIDAIYFCPHYPNKDYVGRNPKYGIECDCRKPKIGMLKKAEKDFCIDLKSSFFIGDSPRDITCGNSAGVTTLGVRTGHGCKTPEVEADYFLDTLRDAVSLILNPQYDKYFNKISTKTPFVINIGGNTCSGKTIFANYITKKFEKQGQNVLRVNLNDWILSKEKRENEHNVYDRFQINKLQDDLLNLFNKKEVEVKKYNSLSRRTSERSSLYNLNDEDIIIIEGIVALSTERLRNIADMKIFCNVDSKVFNKRLLNLYRWKGLNEEEIKSLINARRCDEYNLIVNDIHYADLVVNPIYT